MGVRADMGAGIRRGRKIGHRGGTGIGVWIETTTGIDIGIKTVVVGKRGSVAVHRLIETVAGGDLRAGLGTTSIMVLGDRGLILGSIGGDMRRAPCGESGLLDGPTESLGRRFGY